MNKTIVIGGGPAGMMAAIAAGQTGEQVVLLEKNEKLGKKLYITGKGRCNVTNDSDVDHLVNQTISGKKFLLSAYYTYGPGMLMMDLEDHGCPLKVERGQRVFPLSDKSSDIIKTLYHIMEENKVEIHYNHKVEKLLTKDGCVSGVRANGKDWTGNRVIVATGGLAYGMTGSTGDGYHFAKDFGHHIIQPVQGLVPISVADEEIRGLQGLALKNVRLSLMDIKNKKELYSDIGEMLFTHFGISGPLVLSASSFLPRQRSLKEFRIEIDLKPGLDDRKLDQRLVKDIDNNHKKSIANGLKGLLPKRLLPVIISRWGVDENQPMHTISKDLRLKLVKELKHFSLPIHELRSFNESIITRGGVDLKEINPHTMESKKIKGLYFVGEVLDCDALTGGYNLQIAFSTGYLAGISHE